MSTPNVIQMRESRVLRKLRAGQVASLFGIQLADARAVEIASLFGFDCFWLDLEHVSNDWRAIEEQIWVAKIRDSDAKVRVTRGGYSDYTRPLELDASGIIVPHIMSLEDVRNVVRMTRFHPLGRRPADASNTDAAYGNVAPLDYSVRPMNAASSRSAFVHKDQMSPGFNCQLLMPVRPFFGHVGTFLFGGGQSFF